jgi:Collagen triple helix repeat (20 copies)
MFSKIRRRLTYANVAATLALVFAMSGGAYAAGHFLITSTKQIKPSVLKQLQGRAGKTGANGAQGPAGPGGPQGPGGAQGPAGPAGPTGATGATGPAGPTGPAGKNGADGTTGFTETLPSGKTLKGDWALVGSASEASDHFNDSVSFGIPLSAAPTPHYIREDGKEPFFNEVTGKEEERAPIGCPGSAAEPEAEAGDLCVYATKEENNHEAVFQNRLFPKICSAANYAGGCIPVVGPAADEFGFNILTLSKEEGPVTDAGTWAVTAQ